MFPPTLRAGRKICREKITSYYQTEFFQVPKIQLCLCLFITNFPLDEDHFGVAISLNEYCSFELQTALSRSSALPGVCPDLKCLVG